MVENKEKDIKPHGKGPDEYGLYEWVSESEDEDEDEDEDKEERTTVENQRGCINMYDEVKYRIGEVWEDQGLCNRKTCIGDGTIKEEKCPEIKEVPAGCKVLKGLHGIALDFPLCCDSIVCPGDPLYKTDEEDWTPYCDDKFCIRELGEQWSENHRGVCNRKTCKGMSDVHEETCPELEVPTGCRLGESDLSKQFPECCPRVECPEGVTPPDPVTTPTPPAETGGSDGGTVSYEQRAVTVHLGNDKPATRRDTRRQKEERSLRNEEFKLGKILAAKTEAAVI